MASFREPWIIILVTPIVLLTVWLIVRALSVDNTEPEDPAGEIRVYWRTGSCDCIRFSPNGNVFELDYGAGNHGYHHGSWRYSKGGILASTAYGNLLWRPGQKGQERTRFFQLTGPRLIERGNPQLEYFSQEYVRRHHLVPEAYLHLQDSACVMEEKRPDLFSPKPIRNSKPSL